MKSRASKTFQHAKISGALNFSEGRFFSMAIDFMSLLGSLVQGRTSTSSTASSRMSNASGGIQDLRGSLMGAGQKFLKLMNIYILCDIKLGSSFDHQR